MNKKQSELSYIQYIVRGAVWRIHRLINTFYKIILKRTPVWPVIEDFKNKIRQYPQFTWSYDRHYYKYYIIYKTVRRLKPNYVLELGSGMSTAIIAAALQENGRGALITLDESAVYGNAVENIVGNPVVISEAEQAFFQNIAGTKYRSVPARDYDLIFVDGPVTKTVDLDAFFCLEKNPKTKVLIDNRKRTSYALMEHYPGRFNRVTNIGYINF